MMPCSSQFRADHKTRRTPLKYVVAGASCMILAFGLRSVAFGDPARKDGFNELFISSFLLNKDGDSTAATGNLKKVFGSAHPGLVQPSAPELDWGTINHWVNALATASPSNGR